MIAEHQHTTPRTKRILAVILSIMLVGGAATLVWLLWVHPAKGQANVNSFDACVAAGNPVQQSYPEVCITKDGHHFTGPTSNLKESPPLYNEMHDQ